MVNKFTFNFLKFDKILFYALKNACQLDFQFRRYLDLKICFISRLSMDHKFTAV